MAERLQVALAAPDSVAAVRHLLSGLIISDEDEAFDEEAHLVRSIAYRIDAAADSPDRMLQAASDLADLISSSPTSIPLLLDLAMDRHRIAAVLQKYADGVITRTGLISFISEQHWPEQTKDRVMRMPDSDLAALANALVVLDTYTMAHLIVQE